MHSFINKNSQLNIDYEGCCSIPSGSTHTTCTPMENRNLKQASTSGDRKSSINFYSVCGNKKSATFLKVLHASDHEFELTSEVKNYDSNHVYAEAQPSANKSEEEHFSNACRQRFTHCMLDLKRKRCARKFSYQDSLHDISNTSFLLAIYRVWYLLHLQLRSMGLQKMLVIFTLLLTCASLCVESASLVRRLEENAQNLQLLKKENYLGLHHIEENFLPLLTSENGQINSVLQKIKLLPVRTKRAADNRKGSKRRSKKGRKGRRRERNRKSNKGPTVQKESLSEMIHREVVRHREAVNSPRKQRFYNKIGNSFHLAVWPKGRIGGENSFLRSNYSILETRAVGKDGIVTIKGAVANRYICVTKKGTVKAKKKYSSSRCRFKERLLSNKQNTYESLSCKGCYLNLNSKGKVRRLKRTNPNMKQTHFLPLVIKQNSRRYLAANRPEVLTVDVSDLNANEVPPTHAGNVHSYAPDKNNLTQNKVKASKHLSKIAVRQNRSKIRRAKNTDQFPSHRNFPMNTLSPLQQLVADDEQTESDFS